MKKTSAGRMRAFREWQKNLMITSDDFNINFNSEEAEPLITFLDEKFELKSNTDRTHRSGTTIDAAFYRNIENLHSKLFVLLKDDTTTITFIVPAPHFAQMRYSPPKSILKTIAANPGRIQLNSERGGGGAAACCARVGGGDWRALDRAGLPAV
ncbi:hypothetical protein EVAR_784_1 [Eumeta japonica]|uniref:Uncharacterized protein n=1 Tax=Eumeta variegata TaxID=151549 RepID=A0A4C1SEZ5_EUMVA|nr:hypothetical protein EVAR_784_1 [Eumeta japonica]